MRIMTSNIWGDYFGNEVSSREGQLYNVYKKYDPDIIGVQEVTGGWYKGEMFHNLEKDGYTIVGAFLIHTEDYSGGIGGPLHDGANFVPMFVRRSKYKILECGYEMLRNTPDRSKAITWAVLEDRETGKVFGAANTHFWWMSRGTEDNLLRAENAKQLVAVMKYINGKYFCPVFSFGDMNTRLGSEVFEVYDINHVEHLLDKAEKGSKVASHHGDPVRGEDGRYHGKKTENDKTMSIDHMVGYGEGYKVSEYYIVEDQDALDATDHSPVYVDIELF
jgi:endonuclease/exonuclease/phosphatase family metal-dependent hydrolase